MTLALGIDIGTTKIAATVLDRTPHSVRWNGSLAHGAASARDRGEQDMQRIEETLDCLVRQIPPDVRRNISCLGFTGQMHGVVLWNAKTNERSPLVTWQDERCNEPAFQAHLADRLGQHNLRSGYGVATLAWFAQRENECLRRFDRAATVHDYFVAQIVGMRTPLTDPSDAASWGLFDPWTRNWNMSSIGTLGIDERFLPEVVDTGCVAGLVSAAWAERWEIAEGGRVVVAFGDNQASLLATIESDEEDLGLTLGTGAQLAAVVTPDDRMAHSAPVTCELRPYVDHKWILTAASLCGGGTWCWLAETVEQWLRDLQLPVPPREELFARMDALGLQSTGDDGLRLLPTFSGERYNPHARGEIKGITPANFSLGNISRALAKGIALQLKNMMPHDVVSTRSRVVGSGNLLRKSALVRASIEEVFGLPVVIPDIAEEAAQGAARLALRARP